MKKYPMRFPEELYKLMKAAADSAGKSVNAWVVDLIGAELGVKVELPQWGGDRGVKLSLLTKMAKRLSHDPNSFAALLETIRQRTGDGAAAWEDMWRVFNAQPSEQRRLMKLALFNVPTADRLEEGLREIAHQVYPEDVEGGIDQIRYIMREAANPTLLEVLQVDEDGLPITRLWGREGAYFLDTPTGEFALGKDEQRARAAGQVYLQYGLNYLLDWLKAQ